MINVEYKYHDFQAAEKVDRTATVQVLNFINQGDTDQTHDGAMFRMKSIQLNGTLTLSSPTAHKTRIALVLDTDSASNTVTPSYSDIYDSFGYEWNAMRNLDNRSRFIIMKQWDISLSPNSREQTNIKYFRKLDHKVQIIGTTASESNLRKNALYLVMLSDASNGANEVDFDYTTRIRYIDN
jgi:hypothetical protein